MSPLLTIAVCLVGGAGAVARLLVDGAVSTRAPSGFPLGTLAVNLAGAVVLGVIFGAAIGSGGYDVAATGLVGSFTTFSTWMLESHRLAEDGNARLAIANVALSLLLGVLAAWAGQQLGASL